MTMNATSSFLGQFDRKVLNRCSNTEEEYKRNPVLPTALETLAGVVSEDWTGLTSTARLHPIVERHQRLRSLGKQQQS
jgi:hypothetical protein